MISGLDPRAPATKAKPVNALVMTASYFSMNGVAASRSMLPNTTVSTLIRMIDPGERQPPAPPPQSISQNEQHRSRDRRLQTQCQIEAPEHQQRAEIRQHPSQGAGHRYRDSSSDSSPCSICFGVGGQPRITRSTGTTVETPPTTA